MGLRVTRLNAELFGERVIVSNTILKEFKMSNEQKKTSEKTDGLYNLYNTIQSNTKQILGLLETNRQLLDDDTRLTGNLKSLVGNRFTHLIGLVIKSYKANDIRFRNVDKAIDELEAKKQSLLKKIAIKQAAVKKLEAKTAKNTAALETAKKEAAALTA
jgi:hypothetical protein